MAMLLAMFQKMRLIREKNQLVLEQSLYSSKLSRVEKNIERTQKRYTSLFTQLEQRAKMMQNQAKIGLQNMFGLGANSFNPYNYSGITQNVYNNTMQMMLKGGYEYAEVDPTTGQVKTDSDNNAIMTSLPGISQAQFQQMMNYYQQYGSFGTVYEYKSDGKTIDTSKPTELCGNQSNKAQQWNQHECAAFTQALQQAKMKQQQDQTMCQQLCTDYDTNISIWLEAAKAELEAQQDAALDPLNYEQTMLELDKELKENRLKRIEAEIESYSQLADKGAQDAAPKFGLG